MKDPHETKALIDSDSKVNTMTPASIANLDFKV